MSMRKLLAAIRRADYEYNLIEENDHIALGISGGKDSMMMLLGLKVYQQFKHKNFTFTAIFLDLGFPHTDTLPLIEYCKKNQIPLRIIDSKDVFTILTYHTDKRGLLPCSICSRMKKAAINKAAKEEHCNKVAFAHHADDAIETLFMNMIYGGRVATFAPKMHLTNADITFIRPLIYAREDLIDKLVKKEKLPIIKSPCPNDKKTQREEIKLLTKTLYEKYPFAYKNFADLLANNQHFDLYYDKKDFQLNNGITIRKAEYKNDLIEVFNLINKTNNTISLDPSEEFFILFNQGKAESLIITKLILEKELRITHVLSLVDDNLPLLLNYVENYYVQMITPLMISTSLKNPIFSEYEKKDDLLIKVIEKKSSRFL